MTANMNNIFKEKTVINFLFSALFFSYIAGNLILNLNIVLILVFGLIFFKTAIFKIKFSLLDKLVILLFIYILINGALNNYFYNTENANNDHTVLIKSIFFIRFLLLYFLVNYLIEKNILNLKIFFISASLAVIFVCLDLLYQFYFGKDIFGFEGIGRRLGGPFGDELIAGSFILRFGLFSFFLFPFYLKMRSKFFLYFLPVILFFLMFSSLILSGNRTPFFMFLILFSLVIFFEKKLRKFFLLFVTTIILLVSIIYNFHQPTQDHLSSYRDKIKSFILVFSNENILSEQELEANYRNEKKSNMFYTFQYKGNFYKMRNTYAKEFKTGYVTWKENKFFGGGIKSFITNCSKAKIPNCVNHPHNYYLEILSELGLFGFFLILIIFSIIFLKSFIKKYFSSGKYDEYYIITPFIFLFLIEVFPIKNTGSFFSTINATYIFLILSILVSLLKSQYLIEKKT
tara:strand:- start:2994 stop:4367 length:1374 start_codon:yes stop_codon:yes gene_type:complete